MVMDMPKSALAVLDFLTKSGPLAPREISRRIAVPLRTVTFALTILYSEKVLRKVPNLMDMRCPLYVVDPEKARTVFMKYGRTMY